MDAVLKKKICRSEKVVCRGTASSHRLSTYCTAYKMKLSGEMLNRMESRPDKCWVTHWIDVYDGTALRCAICHKILRASPRLRPKTSSNWEKPEIRLQILTLKVGSKPDKSDRRVYIARVVKYEAFCTLQPELSYANYIKTTLDANNGCEPLPFVFANLNSTFSGNYKP